MSLLGASTALALFLTLCYVPGWVVARGGRMPLDAFGRLWVGVAICSAVGLVLGEYGWFSLVSVAVAAALVTALTVVAARLLPTAATPAGTPEVSAPRAVRALAGASALVLVVWSWPPFVLALACVLVGMLLPGAPLATGAIVTLAFIGATVAIGALGMDDVRLLRDALGRTRRHPD